MKWRRILSRLIVNFPAYLHVNWLACLTSSSNRQTYRQTSGLSLKLTRIYPPRRQGISIEMREKRVFCISRRAHILYLTHSSLIKSVTAKTHWLSDVAFWKLSVSWRDVIPKINFLDILLSTISSTFFLFLFVRRPYYIADARTHEMRFQSFGLRLDFFIINVHRCH